MFKRLSYSSPVIGGIIKYFGLGFFIFSMITVCLNAQNTPYWSWAQSTQGISGGNNLVESDGLGNSYVTGTYSGTINIGGMVLVSEGSNDIFLTKLNPQGEYLWAVRAGGSNSDTIDEIAMDVSGNCYLIGNFEGTANFGAITLVSSGLTDVYIAKLDNLGNFIWAIKAGGLDWDDGTGITADISGNCYITGTFRGTSTWGSYSLNCTGQNDVVVAKISNLGIFQWAVKSEGDSWHYADNVKVKVDILGNCYIAGSFSSTLALSGNVIHSYNGPFFVAKLNNAGVVQSVQQTQIFGFQSGGTYCVDMDTDTLGNCIVILKEQLQWDEYYADYYAIYVLHNDLSNVSYQCDAGVIPDGVSIDALGNCYVTGRFNGTVDFGTTHLVSNGSSDIFVLRFSNPINGEYEFALQAGGTGWDYATDIKVGNNGNCFITGSSSGTVNFGSNTIGVVGSSSMFIAKLQCFEAFSQPNVSISLDASHVSLTWNAVAFATSYRIESSSDPYVGYTTKASTSNTSYSEMIIDSHAFYRVVASSGRVESNPSDVVGYIKYPCVIGDNLVAMPLVQPFVTTAEFGTQFAESINTINIWNPTSQAWDASVNYGDGFWDPELPIGTGSVLFFNTTNPLNYYSNGSLPMMNAQYQIVIGDNSVMIPLNQSTLSTTALVGFSIGDGETVNTINLWNSDSQAWDASVNYGGGFWDPELDTNIGTPLFLNSATIETWPTIRRSFSPRLEANE